MNIVAITVIVMAVLGILAAAVLFAVAKKFRVQEDPRIDIIESLLPGANCGGCGRSGCRDFAVTCVKSTSLDGVVCPGAGNEVMKKIAGIVGLAPVETEPRVAVLHCKGSCSLRPRVNRYDGVHSCSMEASLYSGETACAYGCLGCGDCVDSCPYDAMRMDSETGLPVVDFSRCVGCGKCVKACPRSLFELRAKRVNIVSVACRNRDKGALAMKECEVSCIGCGKCRKECPSEAITIDSFVAAIDGDKCTACGKCIEVCPRKCIIAQKGADGQKVTISIITEA